MPDTAIVEISNEEWTDVSAGEKYGFFTNHNDQYILYLESLAKPVDTATRGHRLNPGADKQFVLSGSQKIWARAAATLSNSAAVIVSSGYNSLTSGGPQSRDFLQAVNQGDVEGHSLVHKLGSNSTLAVTNEGISEIPGPIFFAQAAETLDVISSDIVADISTGVGARTVFIEGLDTDFNPISELLTLENTVQTTVNSYRRVNDMRVVTVGAYTGSNAGNITATGTVSTVDTARIGAGDGMVSDIDFCIPVGKTGYILRVNITMDSGKAININMNKRLDAGIITPPFVGTEIIHRWTGLAAPIDERFLANHVVPQTSDIWFDGNTVGAGPLASVFVDYDLLLVDN